MGVLIVVERCGMQNLLFQIKKRGSYFEGSRGVNGRINYNPRYVAMLVCAVKP